MAEVSDGLRQLITAFFNARSQVIPNNTTIAPLYGGGDPESQDEYGPMELDLDDPEVLAALGEKNESHSAFYEEEEAVSQVRS